MEKVLLGIILIIIFSFPNVSYARSGCCSHHGGVAGCSSNGRQICNDGTLSPSCTCTPAYVYGCMDSSAKNYNRNANRDDGSCSYYKYGCTDINSINYDGTAEKDDGNCIPIVYGCMDIDAINYKIDANTNDNSCIYPSEGKPTQNTNEIKNNEEIKENHKVEDDDSSGLDSLIGLGILGSGGYLLYKKRKK